MVTKSIRIIRYIRGRLLFRQNSYTVEFVLNEFERGNLSLGLLYV